MLFGINLQQRKMKRKSLNCIKIHCNRNQDLLNNKRINPYTAEHRIGD